MNYKKLLLKFAGIRTFRKSLLLLAICGQILILCPGASVYADSCSPSSHGTDNVKVSIPAASTYTIWTRIKLPSVSNAGVLLNIDNGAHCYDVGAGKANSWDWIDFSDGNSGSMIQVSLSKGQHSFMYAGLMAGSEVDRIEALAQNSCKPSGTGDNCASVTSSGSGSTGSKTSGSSSSSNSSSGNTSSSGSGATSGTTGSTGTTGGNGNGTTSLNSQKSNTSPVKMVEKYWWALVLVIGIFIGLRILIVRRLRRTVTVAAPDAYSNPYGTPGQPTGLPTESMPGVLQPPTIPQPPAAPNSGIPQTPPNEGNGNDQQYPPTIK